MLKLFVATLPILTAALFAAAPARAAILGADAASCRAGSSGPAAIVHISGLKTRAGTIRVQSYGGDPERYFDKGSYLKRIEIQSLASDPLQICVPVPRPGNYAFSVRHDVNNNGKSDKSDGGGMSGNPELSLFDLVFKRKPSASKVAVGIDGVKHVNIVMRYVQGGSFAPISGRQN